jgi:hypothetical protein
VKNESKKDLRACYTFSTALVIAFLMGHFFPKLVNIRSGIRFVSSAGIFSIGLDIHHLHICVHSLAIYIII